MASIVSEPAVLDALSAKATWMSLLGSSGELRALGYSRVTVSAPDWDGGQIATKSFGPAQSEWRVSGVALLTVAGEQLVATTFDPVAVFPGQKFLFDMELSVL